MKRSTHRLRTLAVAPRSRTLGFVVMEGSDRLVDWGTRGTRHDKARKAWRTVFVLIDAYHPDMVILEDVAGSCCRRAPRIRRLVQGLAKRVDRRGLPTVAVCAGAVRRHFRAMHAYNKHEIAHALATQFPELTPRLPPPRELWMAEDERHSIFEAVAFAMTHLHVNQVTGSTRCHTTS